MARTREDVLADLESARAYENLAYAAACEAEMTFRMKDDAAISATALVERLERELDECDFDVSLAALADDVDESMDGDHASALASAGFGTDEDYEHNDIDSMDFDYDQPESFDYPEFDE